MKILIIAQDEDDVWLPSIAGLEGLLAFCRRHHTKADCTKRAKLKPHIDSGHSHDTLPGR